jgi:hypothetical protein
MRVLLAFLTFFMVIQCSEDEPYKPPVETFPVNGVTLSINGQALVVVEQNEVLMNNLILPLDAHSPQIEVIFTDDGEPYIADQSARLGVQVANTGIATAAIVPSDTLKFVMHGKSIGQTTFKVMLLYGNNPRYESPDIPVSVSN